LRISGEDLSLLYEREAFMTLENETLRLQVHLSNDAKCFSSIKCIFSNHDNRSTIIKKIKSISRHFQKDHALDLTKVDFDLLYVFYSEKEEFRNL
jgi:hypothetical protein